MKSGMNVLPFSLLLLITASLGLLGCTEPVPAAPGGGPGSGGIIILPPTGGSGGSGAGGMAGTAGDGGQSGTGGMAGGGGQSGAGGAAGASGAGGAGGSGMIEGACNNDADLMALAALLPENGRGVAAGCGTVNCAPVLGQGETLFKQCATDCMEENVGGLSTECASCYADLAWSARLLCNTPCANSSCAPTCLTCGSYDDWLRTLARCAGRMSLDCGDDT
mgnify:FL=1